MARMHSRAKGESGSTRPSKTSKPSWMRYSEKEIEIIITKLAKEGKSTAEIGVMMRDSYGIPSVKEATGKKVSQIIQEKDLSPEIPEELNFLLKKAAMIRKHIESNNQDKTAKRGLQLTESKIKRLVNYYKRNDKLPLDWKYNPKNLGMYL